MRRFTILGLMGLVLGLAVAIAALRNADDYWAGGLMMATAGLIGVAALGAFYHSGRRRARRLGFVVFGGGYFALVFLGLHAGNLAKLPTTWVLTYVHQRVTPQTYTLTVTTVPAGGGTMPVGNSTPTQAVYAISPFALASGISGNGSARWKALLPGAANYEAFSAVGHCLFALLAGLLGMVIAQRYQSRQERALETGPEAARESP
jgi:hypothetical protein